MKIHFILVILTISQIVSGQQKADTSYRASIFEPAYKAQMGSKIFIDGAHNNFHTKDGRYYGFSKVLEKDGYKLYAFDKPFSAASLKNVDILVISNALHKDNLSNWHKPTYSAFKESEIKALEKWVDEGGSLFLIADHMPMAGAAKDLAAAFGFTFSDGFARDTSVNTFDIFRKENQTLHSCLITEGRNNRETVDQVMSFTGQAMRIPEYATPVLSFKSGFINLLPDTAWVFGPDTPAHGLDGWFQGAFASYGKGKIVCWGEAAMFTTQLAGPQERKIGMNHPDAQQNFQLLLNIIHWLDGLI